MGNRLHDSSTFCFIDQLAHYIHSGDCCRNSLWLLNIDISLDVNEQKKRMSIEAIQFYVYMYRYIYEHKREVHEYIYILCRFVRKHSRS